MVKKVYKLKFKKGTFFHFGENFMSRTKYFFPSDSFVSALINNYVNYLGDKQEKLIDSINSISSVFFGIDLGEESIYFLPSSKIIKYNDDIVEENRKIPKKIKFISKGVLELWNKEGKEGMNKVNLDFIDNYKFLILKEEMSLLKNKVRNFDDKIISDVLEQKVKLNYDEDNDLFSIKSFSFNTKLDVFFYFLVDLEDVNTFEKSLEILIYAGGLGGRISSGKGLLDSYESFKLDFENEGDYYFLLGSYVPNDEEIKKNVFENSKYNLSSRKGFVYGFDVKRKDCFVVEEGSVFNNEVKGDVVDLTPEGFGNFEIKRFCKPFFIKIRGDLNG